jgi:oligoribonuclease NrnB/cAMP/cGMP phosphodiesterase (DHH superfamily)
MEKIRNIIDPKDIEVIIYHHPCVDGYSSAFVAKLYVSKVICIPKKINNMPIDYNLIKGKNVLMVDIVTDDYQQVKEHAKNLIILDHHITNKDKLKGCEYAYFDMNKSGVGLAWEYFFRTDEKMPLFLKCIMDRDIWTWIYPESKHFTEGLYDELNLDDLDFNIFMDLMDEYLNKNENKPIFMKYYNLGEIYNKQKKKNIEDTIKNAYNKYNLLVNDITYTIYIYNVTGSYTSDLGNYVVENMDCDFCVIWHYSHNNEEYKYSFRSIDRKTDVGMIAQSYGGGGHRNAAGLSSKLHPKELFGYKKIEMIKS